MSEQIKQKLSITALRIKSLREENKMTYQDIADIVGVNKSTVMRWEKGEVDNMGLTNVSKLAQALKVYPHWIMGWEDGNGNISDISESQLEEIKANSIHIHKGVITKYNLLSDENKRTIDANIEFLLNQQGVSGKGE